MTFARVLLVALVSTFSSARGEDSARYNTLWIPAMPEVLTYRTSSPSGEGLYQLSLARKDSLIECSIVVVSAGYSKSVWGAMNSNMCPLRSTARITIHDRVLMETQCSYGAGRLQISTLMAPYHQTMQADTSFAGRVIDFSQMPLLLRTLPLKQGSTWRFTSLNPQRNSLVPLLLTVVGREDIRGRECMRVVVEDFEGKWSYWVEAGGLHRIVRAEAPEKGFSMELQQ